MHRLVFTLAGIIVVVGCAGGSKPDPRLYEAKSYVFAGFIGPNNIEIDVVQDPASLEPMNVLFGGGAWADSIASWNDVGVPLRDEGYRYARQRIEERLGLVHVAEEKLAAIENPSEAGATAGGHKLIFGAALPTKHIPHSADTIDRMAKVAEAVGADVAIWMMASCSIQKGSVHASALVRAATPTGDALHKPFLPDNTSEPISVLVTGIAKDDDTQVLMRRLCERPYKVAIDTALEPLFGR